MGQRYGFAIYSKQAVREHLVEGALVVQRGTPIRKVLELALGGQARNSTTTVILTSAGSEFLGIIPVPVLVRLQSALVAETFQTQEGMHQQMLCCRGRPAWRRWPPASCTTSAMFSTASMCRATSGSREAAGIGDCHPRQVKQAFPEA